VGGDIGWVTASQLGSPLGDAVDKMQPGQMSYPIRTTAGYYILYLVQRRTLGATDPNDTLLSLAEVVFPLSESATPEERQRVTAAAQRVSDTAKSCGEMAKIGREQAPQLSTEIPQVKAGELPADLRQKVLALKVAEASKPLPLRGGIGVIMICHRQNPTGGMPTREQVADSLGRERLDALARRYMRNLRRGAFVDIRE
jgi:peptidyl-prolyl cis-trans isomerase SurA